VTQQTLLRKLMKGYPSPYQTLPPALAQIKNGLRP